MIILLVVLLLLVPSCSYAYSDIDVVNAIKKAENSKKYPYGIKSMVCKSEGHCRQICLNSVRNAKKRWIKAGRPGDFIVFMGKRYSPPATNPNWVRMVKSFLRKDKNV